MDNPKPLRMLEKQPKINPKLSHLVLSLSRLAPPVNRSATAKEKSIKAQRAFDESRKIKTHGAAAVIEDQHRTGTIVELWYKAVKTHSKIVEEHGAFSGELLRAMLEIAEESEERVRQQHRKPAHGGNPPDEEAKAKPDSNDTSHTSASTDPTDDDDEDDEDDEEYDYSYDEDDGAIGIDDGGLNDSMEGYHRPTNSYDTVALPTLPPQLPTNAIFRTASRRMPPLLADWAECIFCVDRAAHDVTYFDVATGGFLGRIQLSEVARVTLSATEAKRSSMRNLKGGGFGAFLTGSTNQLQADEGEGAAGGVNGDVENQGAPSTDVISPLSNGAMSLKSSGSMKSRMGRYKLLSTMILLKQGAIMHVKFSR